MSRCWCGRPVQDSTGLDHRCTQCAKHCEIERYRAGESAALAPLYDAALPDDAPGAWIRDAIRLLELGDDAG